jgi:pimeloyl-ACP methyl ester carboxylesterase
MSTRTRARFRTSSGDMTYTDVGEGPALLLLHTHPQSSLEWHRFVPMLATRFRVIAPDLLGAGESVAAEDAPPDLSAQAGSLRELLRHLHVERLAVVGHGDGGGIAQLLAIHGERVEAMVLMAPVSLDDPSLREREPDVAGITCPVLILWGEDDPVIPVANADRLNETIASSTLALLPGCGHDLPEEAAETLAPMILEYLRAMYLRAPHGHGDEKDGVVMLQLERRPPWVDVEEDERDDWFDVDDPEPDRGSSEP